VGLVAFYGEDPVGAAFGQVGDVFALAVQGVGGDDDTAQVTDLVEQRREAGDLARKCSVRGHAEMDPGRS
jgi:hypothetical protein